MILRIYFTEFLCISLRHISVLLPLIYSFFPQRSLLSYTTNKILYSLFLHLFSYPCMLRDSLNLSASIFILTESVRAVPIMKHLFMYFSPHFVTFCLSGPSETSGNVFSNLFLICCSRYLNFQYFPILDIHMDRQTHLHTVHMLHTWCKNVRIKLFYI
jgi:hypothetical protein